MIQTPSVIYETYIRNKIIVNTYIFSSIFIQFRIVSSFSCRTVQLKGGNEGEDGNQLGENKPSKIANSEKVSKHMVQNKDPIRCFISFTLQLKPSSMFILNKLSFCILKTSRLIRMYYNYNLLHTL